MALAVSGLMVAATNCSNRVTPANSASATAPDPQQVTKQLLATDPQPATAVDVSENSDLSGIVPTEHLRNEAGNMAGPNATVIGRIEVRPAAVARATSTRRCGRSMWMCGG